MVLLPAKKKAVHVVGSLFYARIDRDLLLGQKFLLLLGLSHRLAEFQQPLFKDLALVIPLASVPN